MQVVCSEVLPEVHLRVRFVSRTNRLQIRSRLELMRPEVQLLTNIFDSDDEIRSRCYKKF